MSRRQGEGGYVQRMEVIEKRKKVRVDVNGEVKLLRKFKKKIFLVEGGGQGGCELRSEAFVRIQKKNLGGGGGGLGWGGTGWM